MSANPQVLVVGGGPGGAAAGFWLAKAGVDVMVVEKKRYPREKTCGDGLTPRAIYQLLEMGFEFDASEMHRINGLRAYAERARAALSAGCDMVLVCNSPDGAAEVLEELEDHHDPVAQSRMIRLHGRPARPLERLHYDNRWKRATQLAEQLTRDTSLDLNLDELL